MKDAGYALIVAVLAVLVRVLIAGWVVLLGWGILSVPLGLPVLTYWQSVALYILAGTLLGAGRSSLKSADK